jgi:hypothetical protein
MLFCPNFLNIVFCKRDIPDAAIYSKNRNYIPMSLVILPVHTLHAACFVHFELSLVACHL